MKITLELGDDFLEDIRQRTGRTDSASVAAFVGSAVRNEIGRTDRDPVAGVDASLTAMARQIEALRQGQRTLFQLIDRTATIISRQVTNVGPKGRQR